VVTFFSALPLSLMVDLFCNSYVSCFALKLLQSLLLMPQANKEVEHAAEIEEVR